MGTMHPTLTMLCCLPFAHQAKQRPALDCLTIRRAVVVSPHTGPQEAPETTEVTCELFMQTPSLHSTSLQIHLHTPRPPLSSAASWCNQRNALKTYTCRTEVWVWNVCAWISGSRKGISAWQNSRNSNSSFEFRISPSPHWMHNAHSHTCPLYRRFPFYCRDFNTSFGFNFSPSPRWIPNPSSMHTHLPLVQKGGGFVCFFNYPFWARMINCLCLLLVMSLLQKILFQ